MIHSRALTLLLAAAAPAILSAAPAPHAVASSWRDGVEWAQLTIRERVIVRIPRVAIMPAAPPPAPPQWSERKAPRCMAMESITGAAIRPGGVVELMTDKRRRLRAILDDDCPTLDFYSGLYLKPTSDGMICARRDALRSRSGARCMVTGFHTLVVRKPDGGGAAGGTRDAARSARRATSP